MSFALLEILVPLIVVFFLGLGIGWLVWRWRRRLVSFLEWNELATAANEARANVAAVEAEKAELANAKTLVENERDEAESELDEALQRVAELEAMLFNVDNSTIDMRDGSPLEDDADLTDGAHTEDMTD